VQAGDTVAYLPGSGLSFTPYLSQRVCIESLVYRVVRVGFIRSGEQVALYEVFLRRS